MSIMPEVHHSWLKSLSDSGFIGELSQTLDKLFDTERFSNSRSDLMEFLALLASNGMEQALPEEFRQAVMSRPDVIENIASNRLISIANLDSSTFDQRFIVAAVIAMSRGLRAVHYRYVGGNDEVHMEDDCDFNVFDDDETLLKNGWDIWCASCDAVQIPEDEPFWVYCTDSGTGDGNSYTSTITVDLLTIEVIEGSPVWDDDGDDDDDDYFNGEKEYSDESDDLDDGVIPEDNQP